MAEESEREENREERWAQRPKQETIARRKLWFCATAWQGVARAVKVAGPGNAHQGYTEEVTESKLDERRRGSEHGEPLQGIVLKMEW